MILWDTSAIYALADKKDINNRRAKELLQRILRSEEQLVFHNYLVVEATALLQRRLGAQSAKNFLTQTINFQILWVNSLLHAQAAEYFHKHATRNLSFVDCMSFVVMRQQGITQAFSFDDDFKGAGFQLYPME